MMGFRTPQNMASGHTDYFKMQEFEKGAEQEGHFDLPCVLPKTKQETLL